MVDINSIYINNKNKREYLVKAVGINCTNAQDGDLMVRYISVTGDGTEEFYREISEFDTKFKKKKFPHAIDK